MLHRLLRALAQTKNQAADAVLLEALRLGAAAERAAVLEVILQRKSTRGLCGVIEQFDALPDELQRQVLANVKIFHHALRECGRSDRHELRLAALRLIALGRQGKLAYVISENLHDGDEQVSKAAVEAMVALARWVASATRALQKRSGAEPAESVRIEKNRDGYGFSSPEKRGEDDRFSAENRKKRSEENRDGYGFSSSGEKRDGYGFSPSSLSREPRSVDHAYEHLIDNRPEIESAVARAMDVYRGRHGQDLLRAALLLCDSRLSRTLAILHTSKHGGQSAMVRRLQQPPASEHVEAFLLGASHCGLRSHFGIAFAHVDEAPVLDALLRKTHWLKDQQLQLCMHQVVRGAWWDASRLERDVDRRTPDDACRIGEWLAASGMHDVMQDQRMERLWEHARGDFDARLRLFRVALGRRRGASVQLIRRFLSDADERLVRMAAREILRRKPLDFENVLLQQMTAAPESVRRVIARAIGQVGFDQFWQRFDRLDKDARRGAGRAMLKLLPDATQRLARRLTSDPVDQRVKALQVVQELGLVEALRATVVPLCHHPSGKVRSKAVAAVGAVRGLAPDVVLDKVLHDPDPRVRANAIEVLEATPAADCAAILTARARSAHSRERANAVKAMHRMNVSTASAALIRMLRDERAEHRVGALWALRQIGWWQLLGEVGRLAKHDANMRVRRYALGVLKAVADQMQQSKGRTG